MLAVWIDTVEETNNFSLVLVLGQRLKSGSLFSGPHFSEQMVYEFESNDVKHVCASVRHSYLISNLIYRVPVSHNKALDFDLNLSRWLKIGLPSSKTALYIVGMIGEI